MLSENHKEFIKKAKKNFRKIRYVECPALNGQKIYFTDKGFTHLLRKGRELRPIEIQIKRIKLFKYAIPILRGCNVFHTHRIVKKQFMSSTGLVDSTANFWSFKKKIDGKYIIVIVCQINKELKHFLSIMDH